jgi:aspartyl-tRNA(Asn)/glutamyl-tRNA(Gln) amidotransferase subunit C
VIGEEQVQHVARLARLALAPPDLAAMTGQLGAILEYIDRLQAADVHDVSPAAHVLPVANVFRDDVPGPELAADDALANAPQREGRYFRVPRLGGAEH